MCKRIYPAVILFLAVLLAFLGVVLPHHLAPSLMVVGRFLDLMLPVLAIGALLKYIFCGHHKHCEKSCHKD